ncbi:Cell division inhibitor [Salmonella enterica subsp. enterica serovar Daytona]|uniref:Cell division inhibitor n=1 Tax=Salmonella enterica subsp. enterica serovar Daytona TaxID=1962639 RepID=A0A447JF19_SALET|nr:Cell division inhibitor [Salmonella enterica subsp. enterica serovar Daytona]
MYDVEVYTRKKPASGTLIRIKNLTLGKREILPHSGGHMQILITGGTGLIGRHLIPRLLTLGHQVDGRYAQSR